MWKIGTIAHNDILDILQPTSFSQLFAVFVLGPHPMHREIILKIIMRQDRKNHTRGFYYNCIAFVR